MVDKELNELIAYKKNYGNDNIYYKEIIKKKLVNNDKIIRALNNNSLDPESPDDYMGENILPYYLLLDVQSEVKNYICFETAFTEVYKENHILKYGQIIFYILCDIRNIYDKDTGIARHDLIAALIEDEFNWCTDFGTRLKLISDKPYAVDNNHVLRTLTFEQDALNGIVNAMNQTIINNDR